MLENAGATRPKRDAVDRRVVEMVRTGRVTAVAESGIRANLANPAFPETLVDKLVEEVSKGIITDISQVGGYPEYRGEPYRRGR